MARVQDVLDWPPQHGDAFTGGSQSPQSSEQVMIERVLLRNEGHILFTGRFNNRSLTYDVFVANDNTAEKVMKILHESRGKTLFEVGFIEIPPDES